MVLFEGKMSSNDIIFNNIKHNDEVVASDVPPAVFVRSIFQQRNHENNKSNNNNNNNNNNDDDMEGRLG